IALRTYQRDLLPALEERGASLVAVSPQVPDESMTLQEKAELSFPVLSDAGLVLAEALGITTAPSPEVRAVQLELGLDITAGNADHTTALPMPT
ncbi:redoxin domain-containing protein, partial [Klebsiella pneumoniae]